ncbi:MAG: hypothetical protein HZC42_07445 [Candidatus Eisenbacteria bacterium]|nr:hypothetical protein [Candidatus Eisenbacteria bacterium]
MLTRALRLLVWVLAALAAGAFLALAARRMVYPLELDCIEGVMMDHVVRLSHGQPIYVEPSLRFIALAYMPLFATVSAFLAHAFGPHFWEPRLFSVAAVVGNAALVVRILRAETRSWTVAAAGAGFYLMGFGITGSCYDVARPDSLMLFLALSGLAVLRFTTGTRGALAAALLLTLAFFTKQHAAWFALAAAAHLALNDRPRLLPFTLAMALGAGGGFALLTLWLGPWFPFFTLQVPAGWSQLSPVRIAQYLGHGVLGSLALMSGSVLLSLALPEKPWRGPAGLWLLAGLAALGTGLMATLDPSAYRHVLMPTLMVAAVLGPLSIVRVTRALGGAAAAGATALAVLALQFLPLLYSFHGHLPHARAREAHDALERLVAARPGGVIMPYHGFYGWSAGKPASLHLIALDDILRARGNRLLARDPGFFDRMFEPLRHGPDRPAIVTDVPLAQSGKLWASLAGSYRLADSLGWISEPLRPVTGNSFTPTYLYLPREDAGPPGVPATPARAP